MSSKGKTKSVKLKGRSKEVKAIRRTVKKMKNRSESKENLAGSVVSSKMDYYDSEIFRMKGQLLRNLDQLQSSEVFLESTASIRPPSNCHLKS